MLIGVLAIQGAFREHGDVLRALGAQVREIRKVSELESLDGLVVPGGESTTMLKFLHEEGLYTAIQKSNLPMLGTCAGTIVLADMGLIDIKVERNAYGRQAESFIVPIKLSKSQTLNHKSQSGFSDEQFEGVFIRAPKITSVSEGVEVLGELEGAPVFVKQGKILTTTFHPELTGDNRVHELFLEII